MQKISKNVLLNILLISFLFWVFCNNLLWNYSLSLMILCFLWIFLLNLIFYFDNKIKFFIYFVLFICFFVFWIFISQNYLDKTKKNIDLIKNYDSGFNNFLEFELIEVYKIKEYNNQYIAKLISINNNKISSKSDILAILSVAKNYEIKLWDIVSSKAKIEFIQDFNDFEYKNFLLSKNIYFKTYLAFIEKTWKKKRNFILEKIDDLREKFLFIIYDIYPKNEAIFLAWILIWARENLSLDLKNNFNNSGLTHFIAVSGFNITILIVFFSFLFRVFPVFLRIILITVVVGLFTLLVWDTAPVIRASIMGLIAYYIMSGGRGSNNFTVLILTAFLMSFFSPFILNYDISFTLSFLAVLWILYTWNFWEKVFDFMPNFLAIKEAFVLTMSALSFTLPIMIFNFGQVSILAPISNVLVAWTIPVAMLFWFLSILFYLLAPILWYVVWYIAWIFLKWDMLVVKFFWTKNFSVLSYDFWVWGVYIEIVYFIVLIFLILYFKKRN